MFHIENIIRIKDTVKMKFLLTLITALLISVNINSCDDTDFNTDPNSEFNISNRYGHYLLDTLIAIEDSLVNVEFVSTDFYPKLSVGNFDGVKTGFLVKFFDYETILDSVEIVDSVKIELTTSSSFGPNIEDDFIGYKVYLDDNLVHETNDTFYVDTGLISGEIYKYTVKHNNNQ